MALSIDKKLRLPSISCGSSVAGLLFASMAEDLGFFHSLIKLSTAGSSPGDPFFSSDFFSLNGGDL